MVNDGAIESCLTSVASEIVGLESPNRQEPAQWAAAAHVPSE